MFNLFAKISSTFFEAFLKYRKIIIIISLFLTVVCFCVFFAFIVTNNDLCYIPLLAIFVVSSPNMFYRFVDELEEILNKEE